MIIRHELSGLTVTCCEQGSRLYDAWLEEIEHASDMQPDKRGVPWNRNSIYTAMHAYFLHRNGSNGKAPRCPICGYEVVR